MLNLSDLSIDEMKNLAIENGEPSFRAKQLYKWVNLGVEFNQMSDLSNKFKSKLEAICSAVSIKIIEQFKSVDESEKYLFKLNDGNIIEGVFMPHNYGNTLCVSTQVGCRMGCSFCASGMNGLERNLTAGEILSQVIAVNNLHGGNLSDRKLTNIVLMGSGEPLDNYENVTKFIDLVSNENGLNFSQRNISLSTCGLADKIKQLADDGYKVTLSISLHSTTDDTRKELMPIANKFSIFEIKEAAQYYFEKTGRRIIYEYSLIKEKNMNFHDVKRLYEITQGYSSHVNLIMLNYVKDKKIEGCTKMEAERFLERLVNANISATIRHSSGADISGACGQLRGKYIKNE